MLSVADGCGWVGCSDGFRDARKRRLAFLRPLLFAQGATVRADWFQVEGFAAHHHHPDDGGGDLSILVPRRWSWPDGHVVRIAIRGFVRVPERYHDDPGCGGPPAAT